MKVEGGSTAGWEIVSWELSSAVMTLLLIPLVALCIRHLPGPREGIVLVLATHGVAAIAFWLIHVAGFIILREASYTVQGSSYRFGGIDAWLYELPKDLITFAILAVTIKVTAALMGRPPPNPQPAPPLIVRDGKRNHIIALDEILAIKADGNYLHIHTTDGRIPMVRETMGSMCTKLPPSEFIRTHRSWMVGRRHVTQFSGGQATELHLPRQLVVPVSKKFRREVQSIFSVAAVSGPREVHERMRRPVN